MCSIVSPTYHRTEGLPEYLDNYATGNVPSLKKIILIWNNEEDSPAWLNETISKYTVPIVLERRERNSKNERFRRTPEITTGAVLALDDDMVIQARDVEYAYQAWQMYRYPRTRMVGYVRRRVSDEGLYRMAPHPDGYSMVLTKSAFIHVDWMDLWWQDSQLMSDFRDYVDSRKSRTPRSRLTSMAFQASTERMYFSLSATSLLILPPGKLPDEYPDLTTGCEDIAMSYLYAHHTRVPPFWVAGAKFHDIGHSKLDGISTQEGHNAARQACVQHFRDVFGVGTLINTQMHAVLIHADEGGKVEEWV